MINRKKHNNPKFQYILIDFILLWLTFHIIIQWFPLVTKPPFDKYVEPFLIFISLWCFCGISFRKYHSYRYRSLRNVLISIFRADLLAVLLSLIVMFFFPVHDLSNNVLYAMVIGLFLMEMLGALIYFSFRYAANIEQSELQMEIVKRETVLKENHILDKQTTDRIETLIRDKAGKKTLETLKNKIELNYSNTLVFLTSSVFNVHNLIHNRFSTIVNLKRINDIRGINDFFIAIHDKLPYMGTYVGCFRSKSAYRMTFLARYPFGLNHILYSFNYIFKRILPKWGFTREIYFWVTGGRKRILTKAEIYGRLYCCGFEIKDEFRSDGLIYFIAVKSKEPFRQEVLNYGPIIRLNRVGKNGRLFRVYKFRTMYPYSEYLQPYIYEKNNLQEGGKFNHDIRITSVGKCMRKYWLDELPMLINLLKGEMKIVGIRPLSKYYFSLYSKELQEKRTKVKTGLLPPFYADMPKTLDEIQASEMKYLTECEKKGSFLTDLKYFWLIFVNIVFKHARSK